jgi:dolichol-phosphate mannosyltransferase
VTDSTATTVDARVLTRARLRIALRDPRAWAQLLRFAVVGASGYAVNLAVFAAAVDGAGMGHRAAAVIAFVVALSNNFLWNRHWTFRAGAGHAGFQAARFLAVSVSAFLVSLAILELLVSAAGADEVLAQAVAIVCATPLNFLGNRLWSFRR